MIFAASVVLSAALLLAMVLNLTLSPASSKKITTGSMIIALIGGLIFYGIGITQTEGGSLLLSVIRTPMCVLRMFIGVADLSAISGSTLVETALGRNVFWFVPLWALYSMASAVM